MAALWTVVIFGIGSSCYSGAPAADEDNALRISDERLARGEIDGVEYEGRRRIPESGR